jgi:hypothetical protein
MAFERESGEILIGSFDRIAKEPTWPDGFFVPADERLLHRHDFI